VTDDPNAIRENIAETRERLSTTIEEIGERLNPQVLKENVKDSIREATIGRVSTMARSAADSVNRTTSGVTSTIRDNPIPAAMVAIGIGWMIWNARATNGRADARFYSTTDDTDAYDIGYGDEYGAAYSTGMGSSTGGTYGSAGYGGAAYAGGTGGMTGEGATAKVKQAASRATDRVRDGARDLADTVSHRATDAAGRARELSEQATQRAREMAGTVAQTTRRQAMRVEDTFYENPLAVGAVAVAVGIAAGLAVPVSDREVQLMGSARDDFVDRVKDVADDTREKAGRVVSRVVDDTKVAAREEGLTS
jgi:cell division septum initiation protein DivIVA